jgi:hypothetical protein
MNLKKMAVLAVAAGAVFASAYAFAAAYHTEYDYYSDATYTTVVGDSTQLCTGKTFTYGTVTPYRRLTYRYDCSYPNDR